MEGWHGWKSFAAVWAEALNRVRIEQDLDVWLGLIQDHVQAWSEAWENDDFEATSACIAVALERLAARQRFAATQVN